MASLSDGSGEDTTITAADGDKIFSFVTEPFGSPDTDCPSVSGFDVTNPFIFSGPFMVQDNYYGGTGRFAGASGTTVSVGCLYIDFTEYGNALTFPAYVTFTATGTISY